MCLFLQGADRLWFRQELIARFCEESGLLLQYNLDCNAQVMGCNMNVPSLHCSWLLVLDTSWWHHHVRYYQWVNAKPPLILFPSSCLITWKKQIEIIVWKLPEMGGESKKKKPQKQIEAMKSPTSVGDYLLRIYSYYLSLTSHYLI